MAENTDNLEHLIQKLRGVDLPAELLSALGLSSEDIRSSLRSVVTQAARTANDLETLLATFPDSPLGVLLSQRSEQGVARMAVDLLRLHMTLSTMDAKLYVGLDLYGNHGSLIQSYADSVGVPDEDKDAFIKYFRAKTCQLPVAWGAHFTHVLQGLFEGFPFGGSDHIRTRLSTEDEKAYNEQQVEGAHLENVRIGTVPAVAQATLSSKIARIQQDTDRMKALAAQFGTDVEKIRKLMGESPLLMHGLTGYVFVGLSPADRDKHPAWSQKGALFATYTEPETKRLYGDAAQKLGWPISRLEENLKLLLAYIHTKAVIVGSVVQSASSYYARTVLSRIVEHAPGAHIPGVPDAPWEVLGALNENGDLRNGTKGLEQCIMGIAGLPLVVRDVERPSEELTDMTHALHNKLPGRLWFDTQASEWVTFWGPLDTPPAFAVAHHDHDHCPYCVERMSEDDFVRRLSGGEWLVL